MHTIFPFIWLELLNWSYLQFCVSQRFVLIQTLSTGAGAIGHGICIGIFYYWLDWGYSGICWATSVVFVARLLTTLLYVRFHGFNWHEDVKFFSAETFSNCGPLIEISLGAMFMGIWGWWAFEIFTFMATYLGVTQAAAQTIMRSIGLLTFMLPVGYSAASGILSGNAIGAYKPNLAIQYYYVCMLMALLITILQMSVLWFG